jgi:hypothetical protein
MTDDQWVDLLRHVCFNYDDAGLMMYIVGRIRQEGIVVPGAVVTPVASPPESEPEVPPAALVAVNGHTNGHRLINRTLPIDTARRGRQRFTDEEVVEFRRRHHVEHVSAAALAREAGVSDESMRQMIRRDSYAYLPLEPFEPGWVDEEAERERRHQARRNGAADALG